MLTLKTILLPFILFTNLILFYLTCNHSNVQLFYYSVLYMLFCVYFTLCKHYYIIHLFTFFSTQHYVFKMHLFAFLYILFIASNTTYLSRYTFITFCLSTLPMIEISNSLPPNNTAFFFKHCRPRI